MTHVDGKTAVRYDGAATTGVTLGKAMCMKLVDSVKGRPDVFAAA